MDIQEQVLIDKCKKYSGRYISNENRSHAPNATTYSHEFCDSCTDLLILYKLKKVKDPILRLSEKFLENKIETCRGNAMDIKNVKYLYHRYLVYRLKAKES